MDCASQEANRCRCGNPSENKKESFFIGSKLYACPTDSHFGLEKGLILHSDYHGEIAVRPEKVVENTALLEPQDIIFLCVKNYSLEQACKELEQAVTQDTIIVPVMNGADPGERTRKFLQKGTVVDSLIYIVAFANKDYSVTQQGDFANLRIGIKAGCGQQGCVISDEENPKKVLEVSEILSGAQIDHRVSGDIECDIWRKYILNCAYNVLTAFYNNNIGELRNDSKKDKEYEQLVYEAYEVAVKKGVHVTKEHADAIIRRFREELADDATSSLQRDVISGNPTELETFSGYIVREARRLGVNAPVSERMYEGLREKVM